MLVLIGLTVFVVVFKVTVIDEKPDPNISTFKPLPQQVCPHLTVLTLIPVSHMNDNHLYNGPGYMACNGYVPCQPVHLSPENLAERIEGAMPCHNYKGKGDGPEGCW